jgi:hypothetical protein
MPSYAPKEAPRNFEELTFDAEQVLASLNMMSDFSDYSKDENPFCQKGKGSVLKSFVSKSKESDDSNTESDKSESTNISKMS